MSEFVHLHVHSDASLLDSTIGPEELAEDAAKMGMKAMAITEHGNVFSWIHFAKACLEHGVKPIFGMEAYVARRSAGEAMNKFGGNPTDHLVLLAENKVGYENILRLATLAREASRFDHVPRVDLELLRACNEGVIALTACLSGGVNRLLTGWEARNRNTGLTERIPDDPAAAECLAAQFAEIFPGRFYLEVQHHIGANQDDELVARQRVVIERALALSKRLGVPIVGTNDIHFREPQDAAARALALRISRGERVVDPSKDKEIAHTGEFYVKTPDEMASAFRSLGDAPLVSTLEIAERCNAGPDLVTKHFAMPIVGDMELTADDCLILWRILIRDGLKRIYGDHPPKEVIERVKYEAKTIEKMGFVPYFLVVWDVVRFTTSKKIPFGFPGRGSVGGCLIARLLGIHSTDTIKYGLLFERFLNPARVSLPDIDMDFCKNRIGEIVGYVSERYGHSRVARIATFGNLWAKSTIREVGSYLGIDGQLIQDMAEAIPETQGDFRMSMEEAFNTIPELQVVANSTDPKHRELVSIAKKLEGVKRSVSTHACGVVIGDQDLTKYTALMPVHEDAIGTLRQSQFDMVSLDDCGLVKMDFLSLETLTSIEMAQRWAREKDPGFDVWDDKTHTDPVVWDLIRSGKTLGIFTIETIGMRELTMRLGPSSIEELAAIIALFRPGPLDAIDENGLTMVDHYVLRKHGHEEIVYDTPALERILKNTYGIIVYQEQIIEIASAICGFSRAEADLLRKAIGKKKIDIIKKERDKFIPAAISHGGLDEATAIKIWDKVHAFARYGFNKSHAIEYAQIVYATAKVKAYYPQEYLAALLTSASGWTPPDAVGGTDQRKENKISRYILDAEALGIPVLAPDINLSKAWATVEGQSVRLGLCALKGINQAASAIVSARTQAGGSFESFRQMVQYLCLRGVNEETMRILVQSGTADCLGSKASLLAMLHSEIVFSRKHVKGDVGAVGLLDMDEVAMPPGDPVSIEQERAWFTDLLNVYPKSLTEVREAVFVFTNPPQLLGSVSRMRSHPGNVRVSARVSIGDTRVDMYIGNVSIECVVDERRSFPCRLM